MYSQGELERFLFGGFVVYIVLPLLVVLTLICCAGFWLGNRHGYRSGLLDMYRAEKQGGRDQMHMVLVKEGITER